MKRFCCLITLCLLVGGSLLFAADFWEVKDFSTWDDEEISKLLDESPWVKKTRVKYDSENPRSSTGGGGGGFGGGGGGFGGDLLGGAPMVTLRWQSALPIKQAAARLKYKDEVKTSKEALDSLVPDSAHILAVIGLPGQQASYNADLIKTYSYLKTGKRPLIRPSQVVVPTTQEIQGKVNVLVIFPKFQEDGKTPMLTRKDKSIEVMITAGFYDISKKFSLEDMVYKEELDF